MRRWLAWALRWGLLPILTLLVLAVLAVELLSWNFLKAPIEKRFEAATGRSLSIEGELSLSLFPRPFATVNTLTLANPSWAEAPNMVEIERIRAWPSLGAALTGHLVLDKVAVEAPNVGLEKRTDGTTNWGFPGLEAPAPEVPGPEAPAPADQEHAAAPPLVVHQLSISDARIRYRPADRQPLALAIPSLQVDDDGEATTVRGAISFRQKDFDLEANTDSLRELAGDGGAFAGEVSVHAGQGRMGATFTLARAPSMQPARIDWELELQNLAEWSRWAGQPVVDLQTLSLSSRLDYEAGRWAFTGIETTLAGSRVTGELEIDTGGQAPVFSARMYSPKLDVAALIEALPASEAPVDSLAAAIPVWPDLDASIGISIEHLLWAPHHIRDLNAELGLDDRVVTVETLEFDAAGGSAVASAELASDGETLALGLDASVTDLDLALLEPGRVWAGLSPASLRSTWGAWRANQPPGSRKCSSSFALNRRALHIPTMQDK